MKFNLKLLDGTYLTKVMISMSKENFHDNLIKSKNEFYKWASSNQVAYICGRYIESVIFPEHIHNCEILEDDNNISLTCKCGQTYNYIPLRCNQCNHVFVDC